MPRLIAVFPCRLQELRRLKQREVQVGSFEVVRSPLLAASSAAEFSLRLGLKSACVSSPESGIAISPAPARLFTVSVNICVASAAFHDKSPPAICNRRRRLGVGSAEICRTLL